MENTGRIKRGLLPQIQKILFERNWNDELKAELRSMTDVDRAHALMLAEQGIVESSTIQKIIRAIEELRDTDFAPLRIQTAARGLYLLYEDYLISTYGSATGGVLQTARSRNDLNATVLRLRLRSFVTSLLREGLRLQAVLLRRAHRFSKHVMPAYTHGQAALPTTLGHYLAGVAESLSRDLYSIVRACDGLQRCPLGANAVTGTTLPIDAQRTACLLGFSSPEYHSIDAVASRDIILRILSTATVLGITLSRLATDLLQWCTAEFGFLSLPDELVGSSSAMPQKRNPFLLEHVQGKAGAPLGAFVAASTAMHAMPFTNSVAVSTEAVKRIGDALREVSDAALLTRLIVSRMQPHPCRMLQRAEQGYTTATALANHLMSEGNQDFRSAHRAVGELISATVNSPHQYSQYAQDFCASHHVPFDPGLLDPSYVARHSEWGGGPGPVSVQQLLNRLRREWIKLSLQCRRRQEVWRDANLRLNREVAEFIRQSTKESI